MEGVLRSFCSLIINLLLLSVIYEFVWYRGFSQSESPLLVSLQMWGQIAGEEGA